MGQTARRPNAQHTQAGQPPAHLLPDVLLIPADGHLRGVEHLRAQCGRLRPTASELLLVTSSAQRNRRGIAARGCGLVMGARGPNRSRDRQRPSSASLTFFTAFAISGPMPSPGNRVAENGGLDEKAAAAENWCCCWRPESRRLAARCIMVVGRRGVECWLAVAASMGQQMPARMPPAILAPQRPKPCITHLRQSLGRQSLGP